MSIKPIVAECSQDLFSTDDTIQQASYAGNLALVQIMRKKGATITDVDLDGRTAIHWAACGGHAHLLQHFYTENENGFQKVINNPDDAGWTPLHSAVGSGNVPSIAIGNTEQHLIIMLLYTSEIMTLLLLRLVLDLQIIRLMLLN